MALCLIQNFRRKTQFDKEAQSIQEMVLVMPQRHMEGFVDLTFGEQILKDSSNYAILLYPKTNVCCPGLINARMINQIVQWTKQALDIVA